MTSAEDDTVFVLDNFDGSIFQRIHKAGCRIVAPPVIFWCAMYGKVWKCSFSVLSCGLGVVRLLSVSHSKLHSES
jgi:hypothetical protein